MAGLRGLNAIAKIHDYAKANESEENFKRIDKSYKKGIALTIAFVAIIMAIVIGYVVILIGSSSDKMCVATIKQDTIAKCYMDGNFTEIDLSDYISSAKEGEKFMVTFDDSQRVTEVLSYDEYRAEQQKNTSIACFSFLIVVALGFALYVFLYRKVVAKDWYEYTQQYRNKPGAVNNIAE